MSMRERLARAHFAKLEEIRRRAECEPRAWSDADVVQSGHFDLVDAILREMMEPTDSVIAAGIPINSVVPFSEFRAVFQTQIQHILNEGRDTKDDAA